MSVLAAPGATVESRPAVAAPRIGCPFDLSIDVIDRMLNLEIADDPVYSGLEVQGFDDAEHGRGLLVLLTRHRDDRVDCYRQP